MAVETPTRRSLFTGLEPTYGETNGHVTFRCNEKPGSRKVLSTTDKEWVGNTEWIPVIDFSNHNHPDIGVRRKLAAELADAAQRIGFWYASNTPVNEDLIAETFDVIEEFFALPLEVKEECSWTKTPGSQGYESFAVSAVNEGAARPDATVRESFAMSGRLSPSTGHGPALTKTNIFLSGMPRFRQNLERYFAETSKFAYSTLRLFALDLGIEEEELLKWQPDAHGAIRPAHYPPQDHTERAIGHLAHTDSTFFTMVLQGSKYPSGLDVLDLNGHWIHAPYRQGTTFACNVGDYLECWSDGRFRSTVHRVLNNGDRSRYSVPFFVAPDPGSVIKPATRPGMKRQTPKDENEDRPVGDLMVRRFMYGRRNHPTARKVMELGIPEAQWQYSFLVQGVPDDRKVSN